MCISNAGSIHNQMSLGENIFSVKHVWDTSQIYDEIRSFNHEIWSTRSKKNSLENYQFDQGPEWTLGKMLLARDFDLGYSLLYRNSKLICCGGIRSLDSKTSISLSRFLSAPSVYPYGNAFLLPLHLQISQNKNYDSSIITFNSYNEHLVNYYRHVLPKKKDQVSLRAFSYIQQFHYDGVQSIHCVPQHVFRFDLKSSKDFICGQETLISPDPE